MVHHLTSLGEGGREACRQNHVVQATRKERQQVLTRVALHTLRLSEVALELTLENAEHALELLLLAEAHAVVGHLAATLGVYPGRVVAALEHCDFSAGGVLTEEEEVHPLPAALFDLGSGVTNHIS